MKYLVIKNIPIDDLIESKSGGGLQWEKYGLCPRQIRRANINKTMSQGHTSFDAAKKEMAGDHVSIMPIKDVAKLEGLMGFLEAKLNENDIENDSIEIFDEADEALTTLSAQIQTAKDAAKLAFA